MVHGSLALKLRILRAERALTIEQAAERAGVQPETISDAERGRRRPYLPTLRKLAAGYEVPVEELLSADEEPAFAGKAEAPGPGPPEDQYPNPVDQLEKQLFDPDLAPLQQSVVERAAEHVSRWSERADLMKRIEAKDMGMAYSLVIKDAQAVRKDAVLLLRDMMALAGRPLTGEWLKLGREIADTTDRVLAAVDRLKEEHRALWAEDAAAYREMFGAVMPGPEAEPEETSKEEYGNVTYVAFGRANGNGERRSAG